MLIFIYTYFAQNNDRLSAQNPEQNKFVIDQEANAVSKSLSDEYIVFTLTDLSSLAKLIQFFKLIFAQRALIAIMAKRDLRARYAGSFLGWIWSFIQPFVMILVFV